MSFARILVVEDAEESQILITRALNGLDAVIRIASTALEAKSFLVDEEFSLIVLDVNLPDQNGFQFFSEIQVERVHGRIPVIFLTGQSDVTNKVAAFSMGAEDYVVKPFD